MSGGHDITETQLDGLRKLARTYRAGEVICIEGEPTRDLMFLMQGAVEVLQADQVVKTIRGHQVFLGQISFFASQRRTATLRAKTRCDIVRIREERIEGLLGMPTLAIRLFETSPRCSFRKTKWSLSWCSSAQPGEPTSWSASLNPTYPPCWPVC